MPHKRFIGVSVALHLGVFLAVVLAADVHLHGRPRYPSRLSPASVKLVELPAQPVARPAPSRSSVAYPRAAAPTPRPTQRPSPQPSPPPQLRKSRQRPSPEPTAHPSPDKVAEYRKKLPELAQRSETAAQAMASRLKQLGLDPSAAASMDSAVAIAINAGSEPFYHPTTPAATALGFGLPTAWASPSSPLQSFLDRVLPPDKGYDADLAFDASGNPELRIRFRNGVQAGGKDLVFIEHWDPGAASTPSVAVAVVRPDGSTAGQFTFAMVAPPAGDRDTFVQAMAGATMLAYLQSGIANAWPR
ncbi:MAG: hypothetical protein KGR26_10680 [Cyanobacteria bacterium REEB65]|nr:hypothetical protein [Cyanobacteria bacterium REEB65]